jgi:hypothetical protein
VAKATSRLGMTYDQAMQTSVYTLFSLFDGLEALNAQDDIRQLKIVSNELFLKDKKTAQNWTKLENDLRGTFRAKGIKNVTIEADLTTFKAMFGAFGMKKKKGG